MSVLQWKLENQMFVELDGLTTWPRGLCISGPSMQLLKVSKKISGAEMNEVQLQYEDQMFVELLSEDGLTIMAR